MRRFLIFCLCLFIAPVAASAKKGAPAPKKEAATQAQPSSAKGEMTAEEFESQLKYERGRIVLPGGIATLNVPDSFRYLAPEQADDILVKAWGNPPGTKTLGMLFPSNTSPLADEGWGVVITYNDDGHVDDDDAKSLDYDDMIKRMKEETAEGNKERTEGGYQPIALIGWAEPPHYESATHKLYWARELSFEGVAQHTLNYDIRVLGRAGVLSFNAIASMNQLAEIQGGMREVINFADFNSGQRYADFNSGTDKLATYGVGALVAGTIAAKAGFFKIALGALLAAKKFIIIGLAAAAAALRKFFKGKSS
ncbi:MAG: DUF2167 domain-containing protein [Pyrinomonadaceae bacterium]